MKHLLVSFQKSGIIVDKYDNGCYCYHAYWTLNPQIRFFKNQHIKKYMVLPPATCQKVLKESQTLSEVFLAKQLKIGQRITVWNRSKHLLFESLTPLVPLRSYYYVTSTTVQSKSSPTWIFRWFFCVWFPGFLLKLPRF